MLNIIRVYAIGVMTFLLPQMASTTAGNLTITLHVGNDTDSKCINENPSKGLSFTTGDISYTQTCFNVSDLFSQPNTTGFQMSSIAEDYDPHGPGIPAAISRGINYTLANLDAYDSESNYTSVVLQQVNFTLNNEAVPGKPSGRHIQFYSLLNCQIYKAGDPSESHPWYFESCQTQTEGDCHTVAQGIRSFSIEFDYVGGSSCQEWAFLGAASALTQRSVRVVVGFGMMAVLWVML